MEYIYLHKQVRRVVTAGFTLVELLVVLSIIVIVTTITLTSQGTFNKTLILANTAYDIALSFRSAETYGLGSRVLGTARNAGYGLHFDRAAPGNFTLFADIYPVPSSSSECHPASDPSSPAAQSGNCSYDSIQGERVTDYALGNRITIGDFCAYGAGSWSCANSRDYSLSSMDVVFARPNPDPFISVNGAYGTPYQMTAACITVVSPHGGSRYVSISASGAITANAQSCP